MSISIRSKAVLSVLALAALFLCVPSTAHATTITFVSDTSWTTMNSSNVVVGNSQRVCLNASNPSPCPSGATIYGYGGSGWGTNLSAIPGAAWIWAPGITGASGPAELAAYTFSSTFVLAGAPTSGNIWLGADDFAAVYVNNTFVGSVGSTTNASIASGAQAALTSFNLLPFLVTGSNTIAVVGQNGVGTFAGCTNCTYSQHPAGVVFGGTLNSAGTSPVPEPSTVILLGTALGVAILARSRRRSA